MKIRNIITLSAALLLTGAFNAYSFDLDDVEKGILKSSCTPSGHFFKESEQSASDNDHPTIKTKFNGGDILKTTFTKPFEVQKNRGLSVQFAAQVLTTGRKEIILEHLWVNSHGVSVARSYLAGRTTSEEEGTKWSLQYHPTAFTAGSQLWPDTIVKFVHLVIADHQTASLCGPRGTKVYNLDVQAPRNHADYLMSSSLCGVPGVKVSRALFDFIAS